MIALSDRRFWLLCAAFLLLLLTFAVPNLRAARPVYDVVAVLDITGSMNARDQSADGRQITRIEMEKRALTSLLQSMPCGSRLGVGIFVEERPFLLFEPVETCGNYAPLATSIGGINWRMGWDSESHIAGGVRAAMVMARDLEADLVFMTDGQEMPPLSWSAPVDFGPVRGTVSGMLVGVGGTDFVPIPKFDTTGREIGVWKPGQLPSETGGIFKGHEYLTAVNEPHLKELAAATNLTYVHLLRTDDLFGQLQRAVPRRTHPTVLHLRAAPAAIALLLLALCCIDQGLAWPWLARMRRPGRKPLFNSPGSRR
jgi:mxaL protein